MTSKRQQKRLRKLEQESGTVAVRIHGLRKQLEPKKYRKQSGKKLRENPVIEGKISVLQAFQSDLNHKIFKLRRA